MEREMTITFQSAAPRELITPRMYARLAARIMADYGHDQTTAGRIAEQSLAFLLACAANPGVGLAPSPEVDKGWHSFLRRPTAPVPVAADGPRRNQDGTATVAVGLACPSSPTAGGLTADLRVNSRLAPHRAGVA
jgi:hypothetical protein